MEKKVFKIESLLLSFTESEESRELALKIAQKSILMNHLYQDLGLLNRENMNELMQTHFKPLADIKPKDIRWKKFLFDTIEDIAPACEFCYDKKNCFGCEI